MDCAKTWQAFPRSPITAVMIGVAAVGATTYFCFRNRHLNRLLIRRCVTIHEAIKAIAADLDLSDPDTFTILPFPSSLPIPAQRFARKTINGITQFEYLGRLQFRELQARIRNEDFLDGLERLYVYGSSGSGKSHLLAALVLDLVHHGERVFYIPDCADLLADPQEVFWEAFVFAFYDHPASLGSIREPEELIKFMKGYEDLYVVVDQVKALEVGPNESLKESKDQVSKWLSILRRRHRYVFSASASEISNREADKKQSSTSIFPVFGGMEPVETDRWFIAHSRRIPQLSPEERRRVEYITGCIPLLLRSLLQIPVFDEEKFGNLPILDNIGIDIRSSFRNRYPSSSSECRSLRTFFNIMEQFVRGNTIADNDRSLYDRRCFYVDQDRIGHCTCGIAFETMMSILQSEGDAPFLREEWYTTVSQSNNPVVRGFMAERIAPPKSPTVVLKASPN